MDPSSLPNLCDSIVDLSRVRASAQGADIVYRYLDQGDLDGPVEEWSYAHLDFRARSLAVLLAENNASAERALLLYPPGLEFIAAFMGCLYSGVVAVPTYPPDPARFDRTLTRLRLIAEDSQARFILTTSAILSMVSALLPHAPELAAMTWLASDTPGAELASAYRQPKLGSDSLAFLQYTSGSTASPKGVMVTHGNIVHNERLIALGFGHGSSSVGVGWLPMFHDMGLIGNVLQPLYAGFPCVLMSPLAFLQRPLRWLQAISFFRATSSGGPNFAYDLCVRKVSPQERATLDLSSWVVAFNGAEPVRKETLDRFSDTFASRGFQRRAFYPCYGLAEATLYVSGGPRDHEPITGELAGSGALSVSSGTVGPDMHVAIVDPESLSEVQAGGIGEIWVAGPSVAAGYFGRVEETAATFGAMLAGRGSFLRTGDLGCMQGGQLHVTGRLKDLIILRGQNHYPQDIERSAEQAHRAVRPGCTAAFAVEVGGEERLAVAAEVAPGKGELAAVAAAIRAAVAEHHGVHAHAVLLLAPRTIPKTSSGKIQRYACRLGYIEGTLAVVHAAAATSEAGGEDGVGSSTDMREAVRAVLAHAPAGQRRDVLARVLAAELARMADVGADRVASAASFVSLGLDSLRLMDAQAHIEDALGVRLPAAFLWQHPTVEHAAGALLDVIAAENAAAGDTAAGDAAAGDAAAAGEQPATPGQLRMWFLHQMAPDSPVYNVHVTLRLDGPLDRGALERALGDLTARHAALRTVFCERDGTLVAVAGPPRPAVLEIIDLGALPAAGREAALDALAGEQARTRFELHRGPLTIMRLASLGADQHALLVTQHHIVTDGWSMGVLVRELAALYVAHCQGKSAALPATASAQGRWLRARASERGRAFWAEALAGLPPLILPADRPCPRRPSFSGHSVPVAVPRPLALALHALAREHDVTLFVVMLAAYAALLHRISGQDDFGVGTVVAGRDHAGLRHHVGFVANTVVVRCDVSASLRFAELIDRLRCGVASVLSHADVPFNEIVEVAHVTRERGRNLLFQAGFTLENLRLLAADVPGMRWTPVLATPAGSVPATAKFDIELIAAEADDGLWAVLEGSANLFEAGTMARMARQLESLLCTMVEEPGARIGNVVLASADEERALLDLAADGPAVALAHTTIPALLAAQVERTPDALAVIAREGSLSFAELASRARKLAHHLRAFGVGAEARVGICLPRSLDLVVAVFAVLEAGGAYVPLGPELPRERLAYMSRDARVSVVVTHTSLRDRLRNVPSRILAMDAEAAAITARPFTPVHAAIAATNLAYIIYTSGSTGRPKGVMIEHGAVIAFAEGLARVCPVDLGRPLRVSLNAPLSFDASVQQWMMLLRGHALIMMPEDVRTDAARLIAYMREHAIDVLDCTPTQLRTWLDEGLASRPELSPAAVLVGGEAVDEALWQRMAERHGTAFFNVYGPTECTVDSTAARIVPGTCPNIGRPLPGARVYILDDQLRPVPVGVTGEICISGACLARGYLDRPALTAERFVPEPFGPPRSRMYRTGDRGRFRSDGSIEFLGRADDQVKIRGFRIELGEIAATLEQHSGVGRAVATVHEHRPGDCRLVAYVQPAAGIAPAEAELAAHLYDRLPGYMVPQALIAVDALPLTPGGKIDVRALPAPGHAGPGESAAPRTPLEELIAGIVAQVLGIERVDVHDDFFALGGHSITAMQVIARVRGALGVEMAVAALFESRTIARLAASVEEARRASSPRLARDIEPAPRSRPLRPSFAQTRLWFLDQLMPGSPLYNMPVAARLRGPLETGTLRAALEAVIARHEALRTTFAGDAGIPRQIIEEAVRLPLELIHLDEGAPVDREHEALRRARDEARRPFDLGRGPLIRAMLLALGPDDHLLVLTVHHIAADGWSLGVLVRELAAAYQALAAGDRPSLPPLPVQYADYAAWQRRCLDEGLRAHELAYWQTQLAGAPPVLELPADRPRLARKSTDGSLHELYLSPGLVAAVDALARQAGVTRFMVLLAGFAVLLGRYAGVTELCVGTPVAGRTRPDLEGLIGLFVNTLVLRVSLAGNPSVRELLGRICSIALGAYDHQNAPFEEVVEAMAPPRDPARTPLVQVMFSLDSAPMSELQIGDVVLEPVVIDVGVAKLDLSLSLSEYAGGLRGTIEYDTSLFEAATIERLAWHLDTLLTAMTARSGDSLGDRGSPHDATRGLDRRLDELPLMPAAERERVLVAWNATNVPLGHAGTLHERVAEHAARQPGKIAVEGASNALTYGELWRRAAALARCLRAAGVGPESLVALYAERSIDAITGLVAILAAGGAYLPLDPAYPAERLAFVLADTRAPVALVQRELAPLPPGPRLLFLDAWTDAPAVELPASPADGQLAYVIYTSGSTGTPKGALLEHRGLRNLIVAQERLFAVAPGQRVAQLASLGFDASIWEAAMALGAGATLCIPPAPARIPGPEQVAWLGAGVIELATMTPSALAALPDTDLPHLTTLIAAGEECPAELAARWARGRRFFNAYGPTEATVCTTIARHEGSARPAIGAPLINTRVYVLGPGLTPQPIGVPGELHVEGVSLTRGYLGRPALTAESLVPSPFTPGERLYATGDVVRWRPNGMLEFLGRRDEQVKIRGHRIELGEVRAALLAHPAVRDAVVVTRREPGGTLGLIAYVVMDAAESDVRAHLSARLPGVMVPGLIRRLTVLPLTPGGKLDRAALPGPGEPRSGPEEALVAPRSAVELAVAEIWMQVLGIERMSVHDDFFALGGHSLLAAQVMARMRATFQLELPLRALFEQPTVARLSALVETHLGASLAHLRASARADDEAELEEGEL